MENLQDVFDLMKPGAWMASIDLRDAYYTIPVAPDHPFLAGCILQLHVSPQWVFSSFIRLY